jgi:hypothetical protein
LTSQVRDGPSKPDNPLIHTEIFPVAIQ